MATFFPMCCCTVRKFCRKAPSETSAQVGRVATRLASSMVATWFDYSGHARGPQVTGVLGRVRGGCWHQAANCASAPRKRLSSRQREVDRDLGFDFHGFVVQYVRAIAPLADGVDGRRD